MDDREIAARFDDLRQRFEEFNNNLLEVHSILQKYVEDIDSQKGDEQKNKKVFVHKKDEEQK